LRIAKVEKENEEEGDFLLSIQKVTRPFFQPLTEEKEEEGVEIPNGRGGKGRSADRPSGWSKKKGKRKEGSRPCEHLRDKKGNRKGYIRRRRALKRGELVFYLFSRRKGRKREKGIDHLMEGKFLYAGEGEKEGGGNDQGWMNTERGFRLGFLLIEEKERLAAAKDTEHVRGRRREERATLFSLRLTTGRKGKRERRLPQIDGVAGERRGRRGDFGARL